MNIANEIARLQKAKADIKTVIENKGVTVGDGTIDSYAEKIKEIPVGGETESENPFYYASRLDNVLGGVDFPENYEAVIKLKKAPKICNYLFNNSANLKTAKMISEDQTNTVEFAYAFRISSNVPTLELVDLSKFNKKFSTLQHAFSGQTKLKSILGTFDLSECTNNNNAFVNCNALEDIEFVPNTIKTNIYFTYSDKLTDKSIQSIFDGLATVETAQTLTLPTNLKILQSQVDSANVKGWTVAGGTVVSEEE